MTAREERPWGSFTVLLDDAHCKVKRLVIRPGHRLSLQRHRHREERWVVVRGSPEVTVDGGTWTPAVGETVVVPLGAAHRIGNRGDADVVIIEVQLGTYFGEDDIERLEDDYDRA